MDLPDGHELLVFIDGGIVVAPVLAALASIFAHGLLPVVTGEAIISNGPAALFGLLLPFVSVVGATGL
ncbi:MAG: hypothetical protein HN348_26660 [Proteobacteria bacterium]|jgi:hypothetical protein|nr:hypothetical protein [Pseudomonadota bacterium]